MKTALDLFNKLQEPTPVLSTVAYYCDALAGAGKTFQVVEHAASLAELNQKVMIVQPSKELVSETAKSFSNRFPDTQIKVITSANSDNVGRDIAEYMESPHDNTVLLITHAGMWNITHWTNKDQWSVYFDEVFEPIADVSLQISSSEETLGLFNRLFTTCECDWSDQYELEINDALLCSEIAKNKTNDAVYGIFKEIARKAQSPHWKLYGNKMSINELNAHDYVASGGKIAITATFVPDVFVGFKNVTFLGAMIDKTLMFKWFSEVLEFKEQTKLAKLMRYNKHQEQGIEIYYLYDKELWSKYFYNTDVNGLRILDYAKVAISDMFKDEVYVVHQNKDIDNQILEPNCIMLPHIAHGLNKYQDIHNYANIGAYNSSAHFSNWMKRFDGDEAFKLSRTVEHVYQGMMRTSLRNPNRDTTQRNRIVVATSDIANKLKEVFVNATVKQMPGTLPWPPKDTTEKNPGGRPKKFDSGKDRIKAHSNLRALKVKMSKVDIAAHGFDPNESYVTCFKDLYRSGSDELITTDWDDWCKQLKQMANKKLGSKSENLLIGPAIYRKVNNACINFKRENIIEMNNMLIFDIDTAIGFSYCTPNDWLYLFPNTDMVIYSSSGHTDEQPKYRVVLRASRKMNVNEYTHVLQQITNTLEDEIRCKVATNKNEVRHKTLLNSSTVMLRTSTVLPHETNGYTGIDRSKLFPESVFYAPQLPLSGDAAIWIQTHGNAVDIDDVISFPYDTGKEQVALTKTIAPNTTALPTGNAVDAIAKAKISSIIAERTSGNGYRISQRIYGVLKNDRPGYSVVSWTINEYKRIETDPKRINSLVKSIARLGL